MSAHPQPNPPAETAPSRLVAVATANGQTLDTHGGRVKHFALYRLPAEGGAVPAGRIEIPDEEVLHLCGDGRRHVIDAVSAVIVGPSGEGFVKHMKRRGIEAVTTAAESVERALADYLAGVVIPAEPPAHPHEHHDHEHQP